MAKRETPSAPAEMMVTATGAEPRLSKFQAFRVERISRSQLRGAPYNPRVIDKHRRKKLEQSLRDAGLIETLVWNRQTGNLVGGHQRLSILDELESTPHYSLDVAVVDVDEKHERQLNVLLNNPNAQGSYDVVKLVVLLSSADFDFAAAGFDDMDVQVLFDGTEHADRFGSPSGASEENAPAEVKKDIADLEAIAAIKRAKKDYRERKDEEDDTEYYAVVVFKDRAQRETFMEAIGRDYDERYVPGAVVLSHLAVDDTSTTSESGSS